ncbi:hypothetical protein LMH87_003460 [Akanthomyces muscarius]|uniref:Uncharacterized protein n=1 Tax=Akanthomyces muscarius TaxID=2231603 RepID=A0A9W8Q3F0_AKAMU|nr:hypothetical protein LMH87_003460 [Akanthomyces muscarius]KAJ4144579.1 hypothetical protein LMH87_003460 [Akanthomyces muscarius]
MLAAPASTGRWGTGGIPAVLHAPASPSTVFTSGQLFSPGHHSPIDPGVNPLSAEAMVHVPQTRCLRHPTGPRWAMPRIRPRLPTLISRAIQALGADHEGGITRAALQWAASTTPHHPLCVLLINLVGDRLELIGICPFGNRRRIR